MEGWTCFDIQQDDHLNNTKVNQAVFLEVKGDKYILSYNLENRKHRVTNKQGDEQKKIPSKG